MTTREKIKEATEVMTEKQVNALWKFIQDAFMIEEVSTRTISTLDDLPELD